jgi:hypothetical protein
MDEPPTKEVFYNLCVEHNVYHTAQIALAERASVEKDVIGAMFLSNAVRRADAEKVLEAFSYMTGETYTLDNVQVALLPTFAELHAKHQFDLIRITRITGIPYATLDMMRARQKVTRHDALVILQMASYQAREDLNLENVDVPIFEEEGT